jgi:hypothetical protein
LGQLFLTSYFSEEPANDDSEVITRDGNVDVVACAEAEPASGAGESCDTDSRTRPFAYPMTLSTTTIVLPELLKLAAVGASVLSVRSLHLIDTYAQAVCELVEASDMAGVFSSSEQMMNGSKINNQSWSSKQCDAQDSGNSCSVQ